jgi:hypothetical protein
MRAGLGRGGSTLPAAARRTVTGPTQPGEQGKHETTLAERQTSGM